MSVQMEAVRAFNRIPLFSSLSEEETYEVVRMCRIHRMASGRTLFEQGDEGRSLFLVESGGIEILLQRDAGQEVVAHLGAYDVVGELALVSPAPRSATARVVEDSVIYEIVASDFDRLVEQRHPAAFKIARSLSRIVCRRIRNVNERLEAELSGKPAPPPATSDFAEARPEDGSRGKEPDTGMFRRMMSKFWKGEG